MECPTCKQQMKLVTEDVTNNPDENHKEEYLRTIFQCGVGDVWVTVEIPKER